MMQQAQTKPSQTLMKHYKKIILLLIVMIVLISLMGCARDKDHGLDNAYQSDSNIGISIEGFDQDGLFPSINFNLYFSEELAAELKGYNINPILAAVLKIQSKGKYFPGDAIFLNLVDNAELRYTGDANMYLPKNANPEKIKFEHISLYLSSYQQGTSISDTEDLERSIKIPFGALRIDGAPTDNDGKTRISFFFEQENPDVHLQGFKCEAVSGDGITRSSDTALVNGGKGSYGLVCEFNGSFTIPLQISIRNPQFFIYTSLEFDVR